jgi:hypothetical protein
LDEKNPGRMDAMNPLPKDDEFASKIGVSVDDISDYNDNLNQVQKVAGELSQDIRSQVNRVKQFNHMDQITSDAEINQVARKYGFENATTFVDALKGDHLQTQYVESFAKNVNLPTVQAKILLSYGFGIKTQN